MRDRHRRANGDRLRERNGLHERRERTTRRDEVAERLANRADAIRLEEAWVQDQFVETRVEHRSAEENAQDHRRHTNTRKWCERSACARRERGVLTDRALYFGHAPTLLDRDRCVRSTAHHEEIRGSQLHGKAATTRGDQQ